MPQALSQKDHEEYLQTKEDLEKFLWSVWKFPLADVPESKNIGELEGRSVKNIEELVACFAPFKKYSIIEEDVEKTKAYGFKVYVGIYMQGKNKVRERLARPDGENLVIGYVASPK